MLSIYVLWNYVIDTYICPVISIIKPEKCIYIYFNNIYQLFYDNYQLIIFINMSYMILYKSSWTLGRRYSTLGKTHVPNHTISVPILFHIFDISQTNIYIQWIFDHNMPLFKKSELGSVKITKTKINNLSCHLAKQWAVVSTILVWRLFIFLAKRWIHTYVDFKLYFFLCRLWVGLWFI